MLYGSKLYWHALCNMYMYIVILYYNCSLGVSKNLSEDHKPTDPIEMSRIKKAGGYIDEDLRVNGGLNLSRAIGKN